MHSDYAYIDIAIGGCNRRNNVIRMDELNVASDVVDAYCSMFRFQQAYQDATNEQRTVKGASQLPCWSDYLWFDIDSDDLESALLDAQSLVRGLLSMHVLDHTVVFFSGSKGFHIGVASALFGFAPSATLPHEMRLVCQQLASLFNVTIDTKIYNHNRLWRLPNTRHSKTGLYKTQFAAVKFLTLTLDEIKAKAAKPNKKQRPAYVVSDDATENDHLVAMRQEAIAGRVQKSDGWEAPVITGKKLEVVQSALEILLSQGVAKGNRDNEGLLRASECRKSGLSQDNAYDRLIAWNLLNRPPMADSDLQRIVFSAYTGAGYDFGMNHESLAVARKQAEKQQKEQNDDEDDFYESVDEEDDGLSDRRPYTFEELTANGMPEPPEPVGEWLSWRKRITLLAGREKTSGKSTLCTWEAMACLKKGGRVLWISPDEPREGIILRFKKAGIDSYKTQLYVSGDANVPQSWKELGEYIRFCKPDMLVLDSVHSVFPLMVKGKLPDNSDAAVWQGLIAKLRPAAIKLNMAIIWIHHANKLEGNATGSIGITAGVDAIVTIKPLVGVKTDQGKRMRNLFYLGRHVGPSANCCLEFLGEDNGYKQHEMKQDSDEPITNNTKTEDVAEWLLEHLRETKAGIDKQALSEAFAAKFPDFRGSMLGRAREHLLKNRINIAIDRLNGGHSIWRIIEDEVADSTEGNDNE